jgi:hypothetical protein
MKDNKPMHNHRPVFSHHCCACPCTLGCKPAVCKAEPRGGPTIHKQTPDPRPCAVSSALRDWDVTPIVTMLSWSCCSGLRVPVIKYDLHAPCLTFHWYQKMSFYSSLFEQDTSEYPHDTCVLTGFLCHAEPPTLSLSLAYWASELLIS